MRKLALVATLLAYLLGIHACKKSEHPSNAKSVQNLSGSYNITALTAVYLGATFNLYDSLPDCEKDNVIKLNTDLSAQFIDANIQCMPPSDSTGTWSLSPNTDSLYVDGNASLIKSWDGKTLVLTGNETFSNFTVVATTTLVKQ